MSAARTDHRAVLLADGRVLVAGGFDDVSTLASAEIWNPATGTFSLTGSLSVPRQFPAVARLPDGTVLVAGGAGVGFEPLASSEIFDPATGTFSAAGSLNIARLAQEIVPSDGRVLLIGGFGSSAGAPLASAEIYDPSAGSFGLTGSMSLARRSTPPSSWRFFSTSLRANGRVKYPLNLGDCFAYALAVAEGCPILAADRDFRCVDRPVLLPAG
jgi:hypothetical protein